MNAMKYELEISDRTHMALARAKDAAGPFELGDFHIEGKMFVDYLAVDIIKAMLQPIEGLAAWIAWAQEIARRFG